MSSELPVRLVFLGSKPIGYQCLDYLVAMRETLPIEIAGVLTQSRKEFGADSDVAGLAAQYAIPVFQSLSEVPDCDILYSVQYHEILKQEDIDKAGKIAVNLHMAPLPEYRGCNQFTMAIIDDKREFGTTIHRIDTRIDHGDVLFQQRFPVREGCWVEELYDQTFDASISLFRETLPAIIAGDYTLTPQSALESVYGTSLHLRKEIGRLKQIDLSWDAAKIDRYIRATSMPGFEPPYTIIGGRKIHFLPSTVS